MNTCRLVIYQRVTNKHDFFYGREVLDKFESALQLEHPILNDDPLYIHVSSSMTFGLSSRMPADDTELDYDIQIWYRRSRDSFVWPPGDQDPDPNGDTKNDPPEAPADVYKDWIIQIKTNKCRWQNTMKYATDNGLWDGNPYCNSTGWKQEPDTDVSLVIGNLRVIPVHANSASSTRLGSSPAHLSATRSMKASHLRTDSACSASDIFGSWRVLGGKARTDAMEEDSE
jgi:hypothetical protein